VQNVLVTGGAGYIGSYACKALANAGFRPITLDNLCSGHRNFVRWGPLVEADIHDTAAVVDAIQRHNAVGLMHFAAYADVSESVAEPAKYYENNVEGTLSLLAAMRQTSLRNIVFSSSCAVYGSPGTIPIKETAPTNPVNPYGRSKLLCEMILCDFMTAYDIRPILLRYFNASGADPAVGTGENRAIETHLIPRAMMALLGHINDFQVFGSDFPTPDGTAIRDYIHVKDLAEAHVLAMRHLLEHERTGFFNLGTGNGYSVMEVLKAVAEVSARPVQVPTGPRRPGDPPKLVADASLARDVLGFVPHFSDLRTIVQSAWQWHTQTHPQRN
jgi:UDP-arabinose 4-epimerase